MVPRWLWDKKQKTISLSIKEQIVLVFVVSHVTMSIVYGENLAYCQNI